VYAVHAEINYTTSELKNLAMVITKKNAKIVDRLLHVGLACLAGIGLVAIFLLVNDLSSDRAPNGVLRSQHSRHSETHFVFADLDGDQKPDLALVEMQGQGPEATNYAIHLQFSRGNESAIGVRAPYGGLRVAARDVNGDDNLDLVLTSTLDANFIEVLLNDGHGNFSVASGDIVEKDRQSENALKGLAGPQMYQASLALLRYSMEEGVATEERVVRNIPSITATHSVTQRVRNRSLVRQPGRSPPPSVFL
jgi:hypothetical protein